MSQFLYSSCWVSGFVLDSRILPVDVARFFSLVLSCFHLGASCSAPISRQSLYFDHVLTPSRCRMLSCFPLVSSISTFSGIV